VIVTSNDGIIGHLMLVVYDLNTFMCDCFVKLTVHVRGNVINLIQYKLSNFYVKVHFGRI